MSSWPHAPSRSGLPPGSYIVTTGTWHKARFLDTDQKLDIHLNLLYDCASEFGWRLEAWAVFANHYHFVAHKQEESSDLETFLGKVHSCSAREVNRIDRMQGRKVWYRYWDTQRTYEKSYLARLNYVHCNPVKHGLVSDPRLYKWCSAEWFFQQAERPFHDTVRSFKTDSVNVIDDFD